MDEALRVERVSGLMAWGIEQGYLPNPPIPVAGGSATYMDGTTVEGVIFDNVTLFKFTSPGNPEPAYYLAKVSGSDKDPVLMLFDQEGRAEITQNGVQIFNESPSSGEASLQGEFPVLFRPSSSFQQAAGCEPSSDWNKFKKCLDSYGGAKVVPHRYLCSHHWRSKNNLCLIRSCNWRRRVHCGMGCRCSSMRTYGRGMRGAITN